MHRWSQGRIRPLLIGVLGAAVMGAAYKLFLIPNQVVSGGFSGIATLLYHLWGIPAGLAMAVMNLPLFLAGWKRRGTAFTLRSLVCMLVLSAVTDVIPAGLLEVDALLATVYGGIGVGAGLGLVLMSGNTSGGTDMLAVLLHRYIPRLRPVWLLFIIDMIIIAVSAIVFTPYLALYGLISLWITSKVTDLMQDGLEAGKMLYIISEQSEAIAQRVVDELERGVTVLKGKGFYSGEERPVLLCVVSRGEVFAIKQLIQQIDPSAFVILGDVKEVLGEGFTQEPHP
ncbi:MAG: YitT family protein [Christensenellales bacterium]